MTDYLSQEDLRQLISDLRVGPVKDPGLLDSAAARPASSYGGVEAYPDLDGKAAALLESLVCNHALVDGNKRLGWLAMVVFYAINGVDLDVKDGPAYDLVITVASGKTDVSRIRQTLRSWRAGKA